MQYERKIIYMEHLEWHIELGWSGGLTCELIPRNMYRDQLIANTLS